MTWYKIANEDISDADFIASLKDPWEKVQSSFIEAIAYFPIPRALEVKLKDGNKYTFIGVPERIYQEFKNATSKGSYFNKIRQWFAP